MSLGELFNKKVRNLTQVHLSYFGIDQKCSDLVTSVRAELLKIEDYSTAVEKLGEFFFCGRQNLIIDTWRVILSTSGTLGIFICKSNVTKMKFLFVKLEFHVKITKRHRSRSNFFWISGW